MAGFETEPPEVTPVTPPAPADTGPILPPQASIASLGRRVAEPVEPLRSPEETVTPMTIRPAPEPTKPAEPAPYRSRAEALDDAVNMLEEGADRGQVIQGFKKLGIEWPEIVGHGQKRGSDLFRPRTTEPGQLPEPSGEMRKIEPTFLESTANTFKRADANLKDLSTSLLFSAGAISPDAAAQLIRRQARQRGAAAPSEAIQQGLEAIGGAETYGDAAEAMLKNPRATLSLLVDSILVTAPALAATALTGPARPVAAFAASGAMEYAAVMGDVLQDKGIDLTDASKVSAALQNPEIIAEMKDKGAKRGLIIGTFDAISMGMAGRFLRPANELIAAGKLSGAAAKKATVAAWSKELALQMGAGAGGEFAAQQATGENKPAEVLLEGIAEGVTAPVDVAAALRQARASTREAQIAEAIESGVAETDFTREGIRREGAAAAAGIRPTTIAELARTLPEPPSTEPAEPSVGEVAPPAGRAEPTIGEVAQAAEKAEPTISGEVPVVARAEPRLGPPEEGGAPSGVAEPFSVPQGFRYAVTQSPAYEGIEPLSIEDADFELEALQTRAQKGRLTPEQFAASEIGKRLDTSQIMAIHQGLRTDPVGTINALRSAVGEAPSTAPRPPSAGETVTPPSQTGAPEPTPPPAPAPKGVTPVTRPVAAIPGMPTGEEIEEPEVTPVTPAAKPPEEPVTPVTPTFTPTQAAARLPETTAVAPITKPKEFEPATVDLEADGMPTVEVPLTQLRLSEDVPQFKIGATAEGVVEPLGGKFERTGVAPIQVWRRLDGSLEVISGRHRFDLAKRSGETTIPAQIHDEAKGFNKLQASILDAELNIRDGQGKAKDYVNYFKESGITKQDADARGLLARATGKRSYTIATQGSDELIAAVRADQIGDEAAFYIALNAPNDARIQNVGIKAVMDGKSANIATNMMQAVKALAGETDTTLDMFGYDDSAIRELEEMAKIASQKQREIQTRLSAISGAAKNPALAKAEGIDVRDPEAIKRRIEELTQRQAAWKNWSSSPDLVAEIRAARGVAPPAPTVVEEPPAGPSLFDEDLLTAPTPEDIRAKEEAVARRAQEAAEAERKAKADEARGDFVLTGSERAADEAAARGQLELGEAAPEPKLSPANQEAKEKYLAASKDPREVAEFKFGRLVDAATRLNVTLNIWRINNQLTSLGTDKTPPKYSRLVTTVVPEGAPEPAKQLPASFSKDPAELTAAESAKEIAFIRSEINRLTKEYRAIDDEVREAEIDREIAPLQQRLVQLSGQKPRPPKVKRQEVGSDTVVNNQAPPADLPADNRLVLMPCCAKKGAKAAPAMELYKGVFFQSFASNVKPGAQPNVIILSAKHGFIDPTKQIEPYDQVMTPTRAKEMLSNLGAELAKVTWPTNIQDVLIVGGKEYQQVMRAAVADLVNAGRIPRTASINVTSGGIGEQRQQLNNYLQAIPSEEPAEAAPAEEVAPAAEQYTPEQRKNAEVHAKQLGGEIVWQRGDNALIRGYARLSGAPVYIATAGDTRARIDIESFSEKLVSDDVKQEMIDVKKRLEAEAAEKHNAAPFIAFQDGLAMSQDIPEQLAGVIKEWKSLLKLDVPIYVSTIEDARTNRNNFTGPHRAIGSGTLNANDLGSMRMMPDSSYYILFDKSTSTTKMLETIAHEMGHVHQSLFYYRASQEEKDALRDAHKKWLESQKGKTAREMIDSMRARSTGRAVPVREGMQSNELSDYWRLFGEWYADQTARWALSSARPVTIVEKYFKRLGIQLRRFFQQLQARKYLPNETFAQYIEKATGGPAAIEPTAPGIGAAVMGERMMNAANRFRKATMNQFKLTQEQADAAMGKLIKEKILTLDPVTGQFELKDGRFWDREVMLRAAEAQQGVKLMNIPEKKKLPPGRSPELTEAAQQLQRGEITAQKFDELVNRYKPIPIYFAPLQPATSEQVYNALDSAKRDKIDPKIPAGYPVGLRLDIPAFNRAGVFVVSIHEKRTPSSPGKVIGYSSAASIKNVTFGLGNQREALKIAAGSAKDAIQTMEGNFVPITADRAYQMADDAILSGDWVQVGFDPTRHAYFFDRSSTMPVVAADEVIQIGNMILAKGVTYGRKEDFLYDVTGRPAAPEPSLMTREGELIVGREAVREYQIKEYAALRKKLAGVAKKVAEGEVDIDVQRNTTEMMQKSRELQAAIKSSKPRVDTPEAFLAKALQEYDKGNIDKDVLDVIQAAYNKQPELLDGLLLSVRKTAGEAAGSFDPMRRIVYLYKSTSGTYEPRTIRHELSHSLEQMMTPEQRAVVVQAWGKALARAIKQNPDELHQRYFDAILKFLDNPSQRTMNNAQMLLPSYEMYQFINPSEYWAVNAERLMASQLGTAWDRFKRAVQQLFEGLKKVLGFDNQYDVHRVFSKVMKGSKERITRETVVDIVMSSVGDGDQFVTLNNIEDADTILKKYNRPNTPQNDTAPLATFVTKQFKSGKEAFTDMVENPKEATVGAYNYVSDGLTKFRIENIFFGAGLEKRDFERYGGQLRTSDKLITASVALDNAIRSGNIAVEVISRGGIDYSDKLGNFVAVKTDMGMAGVYRAEKKLKDALGDQRGTDIINGYFEAKRSISIVDEFKERSKQLAAATSNYNVLKAAGGDPDAVAQAKAAMDAAQEDVESIKKAMSSVTMSEEEMYEFAALEEIYPELRDMMDNWTAINQNLLRFWRQVGLLSQGRYETLSAIKDYVPWYRIMDDSADVHDPVQSTTRTFVNIGREKLFKRGQPVVRLDMRATAGQKEFNVPASSVVKVKVNDKAVDLKKVFPSPDGKIILDFDLQENDLVTFETVREIQNIVDNMTRNVMRMTMNGLRQFAQNRIVLEYATRNAKGKIQPYSAVDPSRNRFNWINNGKKVVVEIEDPLVASAIYGLEPVNFGKALGAMFKASEMAANILRRSITLSGAFQIKQVFKDAPTAAIVTGVRNPFALIGGVWKGFLTSLTNTDPVVDILKSAGIGGYMSPARTPEAELKRRMGIMNRNVFSFVIKGLDHIGDSADMAQRVAVYKRVLKETKSETQALYQAANVINYLHRGKAGYAQAMVKLVPFMGAYANATDVLLQTLMLRGLKGQTRAELAVKLLATTGALSVITLLYAMLAGTDPEYDELDDQTKLRNVFIPGTEIMLPMNTSAAYIFKVMPELLYMNLIRESTESKMDERRLRRALGEAAKDMLLGPEPVPAGLKPVLEVGVNRSFYTGRDIVPESMQKLEPFMQFTASTSELAKQLGKYTNMSPMNIDHLVRGLFGSAGAMVQWASNSMAVAAGERAEPTRREAPIVGGFLRPELPRGREDLYYDFKKDVLEKYTTYDRMLKQENFDEADKYFNKHAKLIEMYDYINEVDEGLQEVNQEIQRVALSKAKDLTPKKRRSEITELQKIKRDVVDSVLDFRKDVYGLSFLVRQAAE